jgi:6-pyruvoyltetrahydropterin/6-carboxytetrahydropterin synthase
LHGHNYRIQVTLQGAELDSIGLLVDFVQVKKLLQTVVDRVDHQFLNDLAPFDKLNPSAENIARYFYDEISSGLNRDGRVTLRRIKIWETDTTSATYWP